MKRAIQFFFMLVLILAIIFIAGTIGAFELGTITFKQTVIRSLIGACAMIASVICANAVEAID